MSQHVCAYSWGKPLLLSYLQGLVAAGVIQPTLTYSQEDVAKGLQDFLICIEMALAAFAHRWVFSFHDFYREDLAHIHEKEDGAIVVQNHGVGRALVDLLPIDVIMEAGNHLRRGFRIQSSNTQPAKTTTTTAS